MWISLHDGLLLIVCAMSDRAIPLPLSLGVVYISLMSMERLVFATLCRIDTVMMPMGMGRSDVVRGLGVMYLYWWNLGHVGMADGRKKSGIGLSDGISDVVGLCAGLLWVLCVYCVLGNECQGAHLLLRIEGDHSHRGGRGKGRHQCHQEDSTRVRGHRRMCVVDTFRVVVFQVWKGVEG